jgi:ATP-dependent DNA ligase
MLSKPVAVQNVVKTMGGDFWIEEKIDGERVQLHMKDGRFEYFSRQFTTLKNKISNTKDKYSYQIISLGEPHNILICMVVANLKVH